MELIIYLISYILTYISWHTETITTTKTHRTFESKVAVREDAQLAYNCPPNLMEVASIGAAAEREIQTHQRAPKATWKSGGRVNSCI